LTASSAVLCWRRQHNPEEIKMTRRQVLTSLALLGAFGLSHAAPTITSMAPSGKSVAKGQPVTFTIKGEGLEDAICALRVSYGDGTSAVRHMDWEKKVRFPTSMTKTYAKPGKYSVHVTGVKSGKHLKCLGNAHASIVVTEPPVAP
jgi:hypothetical protein